MAITLKDGRVEQTNFNRYQMRRTVRGPHRPEFRAGGIGEAGTSVIVPAVTNVILRQPAGAYESFRSTPPRLKQPV